MNLITGIIEPKPSIVPMLYTMGKNDILVLYSYFKFYFIFYVSKVLF